MTENIVTEALVNRKTGEVMEIGLQKTPDEIVLDARDAAKVLQKLINENKRKLLKFNGKEYLEYPQWQTIGKFYHASAATDEAQFVEIGGVKGFKARGQVIDEKTGQVIGSAEAYCMMDEPNWKHKPLFQLASMAQTRAACKALSNKYRYVAILAGYEPTPAEEATMDRVIQAPKEKTSGPIIEAEIPFGDATEPAPAWGGKGPITTKQRALLFARCRAANIPEDLVKLYIAENYKITSTNDLNKEQLEKMLKWVETYKPV